MRCGSEISHRRCTTPYSSRNSVAGAAAAPASKRIASMRRRGSEYSMKSWPVSILVWRRSSRRSAFVGSGHGIFLRVSVKRRSRVLKDDMLANPIFERGRRARVDIVLRRVAWIRPALFHGDQVVRVGGVIFFLHGERNFVVGLRQDAVKRRALRVVAKRAKRVNLGHEFSGLVL